MDEHVRMIAGNASQLGIIEVRQIADRMLRVMLEARECMNRGQMNGVKDDRRVGLLFMDPSDQGIDLRSGSLSESRAVFPSGERVADNIHEEILAVQVEDDDIGILSVELRTRIQDVLLVLIEPGGPETAPPAGFTEFDHQIIAKELEVRA